MVSMLCSIHTRSGGLPLPTNQLTWQLVAQTAAPQDFEPRFFEGRSVNGRGMPPGLDSRHSEVGGGRCVPPPRKRNQDRAGAPIRQNAELAEEPSLALSSFPGKDI
jgi:hypothetical protein